jgi:uncharacterized protein (TIGR03435 family)
VSTWKVMHRLAAAMFLLLFAGSAQLCAAEPAFEVASVKLSVPFTMERIGSPQQNRVISIDPARATFRNCTLLSLVARAWRVKEYQVSGPEWIRDQRFDIFAKLPEGASTDAVPEMLQTLFGERLKLRLHQDRKVLPVYALVIGQGGPKLSPKPADFNPWSDKNAVPRTMDQFATDLSAGVDRPVIDQTHLEGEYLVPVMEILKASALQGMVRIFEARGLTIPPHDEGPDMFAFVQRWGFKLDARRLPMTMLFIDHVESTPTEN